MSGTLNLTILSAQFYQDADFWGKQDPFIRFRYNGQIYKTSTRAGAGKNATWNENFTLENVDREISSGGTFRLEALDDDTVSDDWLGATRPMSYNDLMNSSGDRRLELYDKSGREVGHVYIQTRYSLPTVSHHSHQQTVHTHQPVVRTHHETVNTYHQPTVHHHQPVVHTHHQPTVLT